MRLDHLLSKEHLASARRSGAAGGQSRYTTACVVAELMGGNINDPILSNPRLSAGADGVCGTLLGPEGAALVLVLRFRVQAWGPHRRTREGSGWWPLFVVWGSVGCL